MTSDEHLHELISRYNEGTLEGDELERFLELLRSDPDVRLETELNKELIEFLNDRDLLAFLKAVDEVRLKRERNSRLNYLLIAAVMIIFVAVGCFWIYQYSMNRFNRFPMAINQGRETPRYLEDDQQESVFSNWTSPGYPGSKWQKEVVSSEILSIALTPLPYLEGLVGEAMRSTKLSLLEPPFSLRINPGDTVTFRWLRTETATLSIEIMDNLGNRLWIVEKLTGDKMNLKTSQWKTGLYYWKLLADDDIVCIGKITVIEQKR
ncbi:MAG: hypothetical protein H8E51_01335 [Bacteroidetes bacterium]|nr:hypothetical protein [Bacteroidota bacterium]